MAQFVLVHGASLGAWCWREVMPRLQAKGHRALAIDLPSHGDDHTPPDKVTLDDYVDALLRTLRNLEDPVVLTGHSNAATITLVAAMAPDRVRCLVYIAGTLPPDGLSMMDAIAAADPGYLDKFEWAPDRRSAQLTPAGAREFLFHLCPPRLVDDAVARLSPEPVCPYETPIYINKEIVGRIPTYYIGCVQDRALPITAQREIIGQVHPCKVYTLDADHSPFFSRPEELVAILADIAEESTEHS